MKTVVSSAKKVIKEVISIVKYVAKCKCLSLLVSGMLATLKSREFLHCQSSFQLKFLTITSIVIGGNGYETRKTSKKQTKMTRFMLEGPRPCTIFVLCSYTIHELSNQHVSIGWFLSTEKTTIWFCARSRPKKRTKTHNKEL